MSEPEETKIGSCHCCGFETRVTSYRVCVAADRREDQWLCNLCASTDAAMASPQDRHIFRSMAFMANTILKAIAELKPIPNTDGRPR